MMEKPYSHLSDGGGEATGAQSLAGHVRSQLKYEWIVFKSKWWILLLGIFFQYVHSVFTNLVYYIYVQRPPLKDLGFELFPSIEGHADKVSDILFFVSLGLAALFLLSPLVWRYEQRLYTTVILVRFLVVVVFCQTLRIMTFMVTVLPSSAQHCLPGSEDYDPPTNAKEIFGRIDAFKGCGDMIFSSHTIFVLTIALTVQRYAPWLAFKALMWVLVPVFSCLAVAARHHYSVDVIVAWYTVPLVWYFLSHKLTDMRPTLSHEFSPLETDEDFV